MGMTSMVTAFTAISNVVENNRDFKEAMPSVLIAGAMLMTMILWPLLMKKYQKKKRIEDEKKRRTKYI